MRKTERSKHFNGGGGRMVPYLPLLLLWSSRPLSIAPLPLGLLPPPLFISPHSKRNPILHLQQDSQNSLTQNINREAQAKI